MNPSEHSTGRDTWRRIGIVSALILAAACVLTLAGAAAAGAQESTPLIGFRHTRELGYARVSACLTGLTSAPAGTAVAARTEVFVDGRFYATSTDLVRHVADGPCAGAAEVSYLAPVFHDVSGGGPFPRPEDGWVSFEVGLRIVIESGPDAGQRHAGDHVVYLNDGSIIGGITSITSTPDGARVRGTVMSPYGADADRFTLMVDGYNAFAPAPTRYVDWSNTEAVYADLPSADPRWAAMGLGADHDFDVTIPFHGEICLVARSSRSHGELGCRRSPIDGIRKVQVLSWESRPDGRPNAGRLVVHVRVTDPWWSPGEAPPVIDAVHRTNAYLLEQVPAPTVQTTRRSDLTGPHGARDGVFDVTFTYPYMPSGHQTICLHDRSRTAPLEWDLTAPLRPMVDTTCLAPLIPANYQVPPKSNVEHLGNEGTLVTASGWALDPNGGSPRVILSANGLPVAVTKPTRERPDVAAIHGGDGWAGYSLSVALPKGNHRVCVQVEDTTEGFWTSPVCQQVVVK